MPNLKILVILVLPLFVFAQSHGLKTFINSASKTNGLLKAKEINIQAKYKQIEAAKSAYYPTLDVGADYSLLSPNYLVSPGQVGNIYASLSMDLYDGGRKDALLRVKDFEHEASLFEKSAFEKSITLEIVRHYYTIQSLKATLHALKNRETELKAQIKRVKKFLSAGLSTQEDIDKLVAVYENNNFTIENTKLALETNEDHLKLISGLSAKRLSKNYFSEPKHVRFEYFDAIKVMQSNAESIGENAHAIDAGYMPQVKLSDTYHKSHFDDLVSIPGVGGDGFLVDHQNKLMLSVNMRIFDNAKISKESEAVKYQKLSLLSQIDHAKKEQKMNFHLAQKTLKTTRTKLKSAKAALKAAQSTYDVLRKKFEAGLVDNIAYLDALTQRTLADARYKETLYEYEIKKSIYYYYAGKDPKEFIR
ncbi:MAG: TolC family protein [Sulfurimonas sp.]